MQTFDRQESTVSLVSWARTVQPVRWRIASGAGAISPVERRAAVDATDDVMFGFSTAVLLVAPLVLLLAVFFG